MRNAVSSNIPAIIIKFAVDGRDSKPTNDMEVSVGSLVSIGAALIIVIGLGCVIRTCLRPSKKNGGSGASRRLARQSGNRGNSK